MRNLREEKEEEKEEEEEGEEEGFLKDLQLNYTFGRFCGLCRDKKCFFFPSPPPPPPPHPSKKVHPR